MPGNNSFSGGIVNNAGALNINSPTALGTGPLAYYGSSLNNTSGAAVALTTNNAQTWHVNNLVVAPVGAGVNNNNSLSLGPNSVTLAPTSGTLVTVTVNSTTAPSSTNFAGQNAFAIPGNIGEAVAGVGLKKYGNGVMVLGGNNTFTGGVEMNQGMLCINSSGALGPGGLKVSNTGYIYNTSGHAVTLANNTPVTFTSGNMFFMGGSDLNFGNGPLTTTGSTAILVKDATLTFEGPMAGSGQLYMANSSTTGPYNGTLVIAGARTYTGATKITGSGSAVNQTLVLSGASPTYSGAYTLSAGTLCINNDQALGISTIPLTGTNLDNTSGHAVNISTANPWSWNSNFTFLGSNPLNIGVGTVTLNASRTVTVNGSTLTVDGAVTSGISNYSLTKAGAGTLVLNNSGNMYGGGLATTTIVTGGTLELGPSAQYRALNTTGTDIRTGKLVFDYTGSSAILDDRIEYLLKTGYGATPPFSSASNLLWSSTTNATSYGLGWADNGVNKTTVMYTLYGGQRPERHRQRGRPQRRAVELQQDRRSLVRRRLRLQRHGQRGRPQHGAVELQPAPERWRRRCRNRQLCCWPPRAC